MASKRKPKQAQGGIANTCANCGITAVNQWHSTPFYWGEMTWNATIFCEACYMEMTIPERLQGYRDKLMKYPVGWPSTISVKSIDPLWPGLAEAVWAGK